MAILFCCEIYIADAQTINKNFPFDFQGKMLVSVSDADMVASAYSDGELGMTEGADALSIIKLDKPIQQLKAVEIGVSNSVTGPPSSVAVTPDGRYAIVIETRGSLPKGKTDIKLKDLEVGKMITVIDLSNPDKPTITQKIEGVKGFKSPQSISINSSGSMAAISFSPEDSSKQSPLVIYRFQNGKISSPVVPAIPDWTAGDQLTGAEFHPKENIIALLNSTKPSLSFVKVADEKRDVELVRWGNTIKIERAPYKIVFTPDGKHVLTNAIFADAESGNFFPPGTILVIRLSMSINAKGEPRHELVSKASTSFGPEGFTISPDGRWVVTTNLEMSWAAFDDPRQGFFSSLTLLSLDSETGFIKHIGNYTFDGILPEAVVFDNSSRFLAVTTFDHYDRSRTGGSIDFWRLAKDVNDPTRAELVKINYSVPVARGAHSLVIVR